METFFSTMYGGAGDTSVAIQNISVLSVCRIGSYVMVETVVNSDGKLFSMVILWPSSSSCHTMVGVFSSPVVFVTVHMRSKGCPEFVAFFCSNVTIMF